MGPRVLAQKLGLWGATVLGAAALALLLVHLAPGDAIDLIPGGETLRPQLEAEFGLDKPLPLRFAASLAGLLSGDWGTSIAYRPGAPVLEVIGGPALRSLTWLVAALAFATVQAMTLAWFTAGRARSLPRLVVRLLSVAPVFLLAHLAVYGLNEATFALIQSGTIERPGWFALPDQPSLFRTLLAVGLLAIGSGTLTELHLELESALDRIRSSGFVDAARARGASTWPHIWPNLVPELAAILAGRAAFLVGGLVILERVLLLNGAGSVLWQAALLRDQPVAVGVAVLAALFVASTRLLADLVRWFVDPRLRALEAS